MSCLYVMCEFGHSLCHQPACMAAKNTHVHSKKQMTQKISCFPKHGQLVSVSGSQQSKFSLAAGHNAAQKIQSKQMYNSGKTVGFGGLFFGFVLVLFGGFLCEKYVTSPFVWENLITQEQKNPEANLQLEKCSRASLLSLSVPLNI